MIGFMPIIGNIESAEYRYRLIFQTLILFALYYQLTYACQISQGVVATRGDASTGFKRFKRFYYHHNWDIHLKRPQANQIHIFTFQEVSRAKAFTPIPEWEKRDHREQRRGSLDGRVEKSQMSAEEEFEKPRRA